MISKKYIVLFVFILFFCQKKVKNDDETLFLSYLFRPGDWVQITPKTGNYSYKVQSTGELKSISFDPVCSSAPGTDPNYSYFIKTGNSKKLLIYFMGGGACWDDKNCLGVSQNQTYFTSLEEVNFIKFKEFQTFIEEGSLNSSNTSNPFYEWNMVFIPYCSGDLFWGSNQVEYKDPVTSEKSNIKHHGFDNFISTFQYIGEKFPESSMDQVFVTGSSAGGYAAVFNFPYIKEFYYSKKTDLLIDAAEGVATDQFNSLAENKWSYTKNYPSWIFNGSLTSVTLDQMIYTIANYYPQSKISQYTTAYDGTQRYFLDVMKKVEANKSYTITGDEMWGKSDGSEVSSEVNCEWVQKSTKYRTNIKNSVTGNNYRNYLGSGKLHTVMFNKRFYSEIINGVSFLSFVNSMLGTDSSAWNSVTCTDCGYPTNFNCSF